jgi:predicted TIM-barrel fold metal-dependent hydrolase
LTVLVLRNKRDMKTYRFYTVDFHHHLGVDEAGYESTPTSTNGSYDFCKKVLNGDGLEKGIRHAFEENPDEYAYGPADGAPFIKFHPVMGYFSEEDNKLSASYQFEQTLAIDQIIVFPMLDKLRLTTKVEYEACNNVIEKWSNIYPHSLRLVGFGRVNPNQYPDNLAELEKLVKVKGLRGLKLHPSSEEFLISSDKVKNTVKACAKLNIPVIFHTTYGSEVRKLTEMANEIIVELFDAGEERYIPGLKIVAGHFNHETKDVMEALNHPCVTGELSISNSPMTFLKRAREYIVPRAFFENTLPKLSERNPKITEKRFRELFGERIFYAKWSHKLVFGTDHPFIPFDKPVKLLRGLLHVDSMLTAGDIERILGVNALRLIPPKFYGLAGANNAVFEGTRTEFIKRIIAQKKNIHFDPLIVNAPVNQLTLWDAIVSVKGDAERHTSLFSIREFRDQSDKVVTGHNMTDARLVQDLFVSDGGGNITRELKDDPTVLSQYFRKTTNRMFAIHPKAINKEPGVPNDAPQVRMT